jgi:hypothetical protein
VRFPKRLLAVLLVGFSLTFTGCDWFNTNKTRPAPVRPRMRAPQQSPAPNQTPRITGITEKQLRDRIDRVEREVRNGRWAAANRETNALGTDMTRFRPTRSRAKSIREIASFNTIYVKLQADVKTRNRPAVMRDLSNLRNALKRETAGPKPTGPARR